MRKMKGVEQILRSVALWNIGIIGSLGAFFTLFFALRGSSSGAWAAGTGAVITIVSVVVSCLLSTPRGGVLAGLSYLIKILLIIVSVTLVDTFAHIDRKVLFLAIFFSVALSLLIDSWVILRQPGPDFDIPERRYESGDSTGKTGAYNEIYKQ